MFAPSEYFKISKISKVSPVSSFCSIRDNHASKFFNLNYPLVI
ncbi:hypothetical protein RMAECT_0619 [Rickettsia rhipicephali str. Ect]|uniref:Uncharacterized protein n=1 Tax=Rickettsia rhipicephali str. Ect TaxID=1359199 RepID=A0A0F3PDF0_RICRH|nr:hypothetical protein RMAECT_0619 [Rickettsia rhipicephali str. Ect]